MDSTDNIIVASNVFHNGMIIPSTGTPEFSPHESIGDCHIFNYEKYHPRMDLPERSGSENDVLELQKTFSSLKFNVYPSQTEAYNNFSSPKTHEAILKAANAISPGKYLVFCIMTHGNAKDEVATYDGYLNLDDILVSCSNIFGKNQIIFIIQACRTNELNLEKLIKKESTDSSYNPFHFDVLVARSTYPDNASVRSSCGTYFIQEVCHFLKHSRGNINLFDALTAVNFRMAYYFETCIRGKKGGQMPIFYSTLTEEIVFARRDPTERLTESLIGLKLKEKGMKESFDLNDISNLEYDFTPNNVQFYGIRIKHTKSLELKNAAASLSRTLAKRYPPIKLYEVFKRREVMEKIKEGAKEKADCIFFIISGPSSYESLCSTRGKKIYQRNIVEYFVKNQIAELVSKPKVFLFLMLEAVSKESKEGGESCDGLGVVSKESKEGDESCDGLEIYFVAQHADILEINITVKSENDSDIHKPVDAIVKQCKESITQNFLSILTKANKVLVEEKFLNKENRFQFSSTLTRKLILPIVTK